MRNRFFFIILASLILGAVGISITTTYFFRTQRVALIDRQITRSADLLLAAAEFARPGRLDSNLDESISKILGGERIGKVFVLRDQSGQILYQSINLALLQADLPTATDWVTVEAGEQYLRIFNARLSDKKILQIGLVLDRNFLNWRILDEKTTLFIVGIVVMMFFSAAFITLILLSPIRLLNSHLNSATADLKNLKDVDPLPGKLIQFTDGFWSRSDEFSSLVATVQKLVDRINLNYKLTRSWTLQMAHELKTPLAIIRAETESRDAKLPDDYRKTILGEVDWTSDTITQFLAWAELENSQRQKNLHVIRMSSVILNVRTRLEKLTPRRIEVFNNSDFSVAANPGHLDQLVTNLLTNALKFSPDVSKVSVVIEDNRLTVIDHGEGIPAEVVERIGQPFNVGFTKAKGFTGHGLGLAWVSTVAKIYGWRLAIDNNPHETKVSVQFPQFD